MIGIIVPVHNEEQLLDACIKSLLVASCHERLNNEHVKILIVLDDCTDTSRRIAE